MRTVRGICDAGRTCLVTVHQPSIALFETFDSLLLLQRGGRLAYCGPLGLHSSALVAYLTAVPGAGLADSRLAWTRAAPWPAAPRSG